MEIMGVLDWARLGAENCGCPGLGSDGCPGMMGVLDWGTKIMGVPDWEAMGVLDWEAMGVPD